VGTVVSVLVITIIPVALGMLVFAKAPKLASKLDLPFRRISAIFFVVIVLAAVLKEKENLVRYFVEAGPAALALNVATLALSFGIAKLVKLPFRQGLTIAIESGIQNGTLGITIAATLLMNSVMTIPSAIYSLIMFGTAALVILWGNKVASASKASN
jgi:BASS family bile acid:Na+ symporter